jgi:hypothetical protein
MQDLSFLLSFTSRTVGLTCLRAIRKPGAPSTAFYAFLLFSLGSADFFGGYGNVVSPGRSPRPGCDRPPAGQLPTRDGRLVPAANRPRARQKERMHVGVEYELRLVGRTDRRVNTDKRTTAVCE